MCGINIIIGQKNNLDDAPIRCMNKATAHRGPDASGHVRYSKKQTAYIGNNRLKVNDLSDAANQPMVSEDGRYILSYNGELYNYRELQKKYLQGYSPKTSSDTEVLLTLLVNKGKEILPELNGMFAFAFYDSRIEKLLLARDASGIKPVYYYKDKNYFITSSELKGILASGLVEKKMNEKKIPHYLQFKYVKKPQTFYADIFELEEGSYLELEGNTITINKYATATALNSYTDEELVTTAEGILKNALQRQLVADVPCGLFLSGGVDSTLLLALIREQGIKNFPTFSIANDKKDKSFGTEDFYYSSLAAKQYEAEHCELNISSTNLSQLPDFINSIDQPIGDGAAFLTYLLSQQAAKQVKVILSGAGADELFAGYNRHEAYYYYLNNFYTKEILISIIKRFSGKLPHGFNHPLRKQFRLLSKFLSQIDKNPSITYTNFCSSEVFPNTSAIEENTNRTIEEWMQYSLQMDRKEYLISDILALTDTMTMSSSIEARVPYLDAELVAFAGSLSSDTLLKHGPKWILRKILDKRGGQAYTERAKEGFGMPFGNWIREQNNILEELLDKNNLLFRYVNYEKVKGLVSLHLQRKKDYSTELWSLLVLALWLKKEFAA